MYMARNGITNSYHHQLFLGEDGEGVVVVLFRVPSSDADEVYKWKSNELFNAGSSFSPCLADK